MPAANIVVENDLSWERKWASYTLSNKGQARIVVTITPKKGRFRVSGESEGVCLALPDGLSDPMAMADDLGYPRRKRGELGRAGKSAPARPLKRADDPSQGLVTREALDVARYITDMTAQLEAMAVAARLDLLAYFLGMAKAESELFVRTRAVAEGESEDPYATAAGDRQPHANNSFD
jgi:hypothetical protein